MSFFNDKDMITRWKSSINRNELRPNPLKASKTHSQALKAVESIFKILPFCLQHAGCTTILHAVAHRNPIQQDIGVCGSNATHKKKQLGNEMRDERNDASREQGRETYAREIALFLCIDHDLIFHVRNRSPLAFVENPWAYVSCSELGSSGLSFLYLVIHTNIRREPTICTTITLTHNRNICAKQISIILLSLSQLNIKYIYKDK